MQPYLYEGELTHGPPLKTDSDYPDHQPSYRFINTVIAISDVSHIGMSRTRLAWENTIEVQNSFYLNLSDTPFPSSYPLPPAGFTVLQGEAARDYWDATKSAWLANHDGVNDVELTPLPGQTSTPTPTPTPTTEIPTTTQPEPTTPAPTFSGVSYTGTKYIDTIVGNIVDNLIEGKDGGDIIWGGAGNDVFVISRGGDMDGGGKIDRYMDFTDGADKFDFSAIDANVTVKVDFRTSPSSAQAPLRRLDRFVPSTTPVRTLLASISIPIRTRRPSIGSTSLASTPLRPPTSFSDSQAASIRIERTGEGRCHGC